MDEQLWYMRQQSRVLQELRTSIQLLWDDEASRKINRGILNPHQEDDDLMVQEFVQQEDRLNDSKLRRDIAAQLNYEANDLSQQVELLIISVDDDVEISIQYHQQYRAFYAESQGMLPEIEKLIKNANNIGNGAPPYEP